MKQKTHKAAAKRLKITKNKKIIHRTAGQDHFNARESGKVTRNKRRNRILSKSHRRAVKTMIPGL